MKTIALIAHDNKKKDLVEWVRYNKRVLQEHTLVSTRTTGTLLVEKGELDESKLNLILVNSGPLGGDQEVGAMIANRGIDLMVFFWDGLDTHEHMHDIQALLRLAVVFNVPIACNRATADMIIGSPLFFDETYERHQPDFELYLKRKLSI